MAKMRKNKRKMKKNSKFTNFVRKHFVGLATALGITATAAGSLGVYEAYSFVNDKQIEKTDDKDKVAVEPIEEEKQKVEPTIEEEIEETTVDKDISFEKEQEEELEEEIDEEETESLEISKDKESTMTSYSDTELVIPVIKNFETVSVVDALNEVGYDSSKSSRARLAVYFKIVNNESEYKGSSEQNISLLEALREYARNLRNTAKQDYAKVVDNKTIENSTTGNYDYSNNNDNNNNQDTQPENEPKQDNKKDDDEHKKDKHKWGKWLPLDDEYEHRFRDDGKEQKQKHPSYGEYSDNGDDTKSRTCDNCGHTMTLPYIWGEWTKIDDEYEYRIREDGKRVEQLHPYSEFIENGDGTESKTCPNCGNVVTRNKHKHHFEKQGPISLNQTDAKNCKVIYYTCPDDGEIDETKTEYIEHKFPETPKIEGNEEIYICSECGMEISKTIEPPPHEHKYVKQEPISLNQTDAKNCKVIYYTCPDDGEIDETKTEYIEHKFPDTPKIEGNEEIYTCSECGMEISKEITQKEVVEENQEETKQETLEEQTNKNQQEQIIFHFDFDIPTDDYELIEEEPDVDFQPPAIKENTELTVLEEQEELEELEIKQIEQQEILQLEDKSLLEKNENQNDIVAKFDKELYKKLYYKEMTLERCLAANKGIESKKEIELLNNIKQAKMNMVQELADALVKEELSKNQELAFKI